jgi:D-xylose transport system permease protein
MTTTEERTAAEPEGEAEPSRGWVGEQWKDFRERIRGGQLGSLPVVVGLAVIWTYFQWRNNNFLSPLNLTNLSMQIAATGTIAVGVYFVLLLGEIDLAIGSVSGVTAAILVVVNVREGWDAIPAMAAALAAGAAIGLFHGFVFTRFGVPSFVVTLAGNIGWQGLQLKVLGKQGSINVPESDITKLASTFFDHTVGWGIAVAVVVLYLVSLLRQRRRRTLEGLPAGNVGAVVARVVFLAAILAVAVTWVNRDRGVPLIFMIFVAFVVIADLVTTKTRYGRMLFAVGGNAEAARRAGMPINLIRTSVFMISGFMAAAGGILAASRLLTVTQSSGGGDVLLNAIAAVVIGGTSLFGGRGRAYSALLGILVIGSISNGMDLLGLDSSVKLMITGAVLLAAVTVDALARRGREATGRG